MTMPKTVNRFQQ